MLRLVAERRQLNLDHVRPGSVAGALKEGLDWQFRRIGPKHLRIPRAAIAVADLDPPLSFSFCHPT
jgi:hypothetical protein